MNPIQVFGLSLLAAVAEALRSTVELQTRALRLGNVSAQSDGHHQWVEALRMRVYEHCAKAKLTRKEADAIICQAINRATSAAAWGERNPLLVGEEHAGFLLGRT